jgi:flagellar basal body P-ring formation protein FlgA
MQPRFLRALADVLIGVCLRASLAAATVAVPLARGEVAAPVESQAAPGSGVDGAIERQVRELALQGGQAAAGSAGAKNAAPRVEVSLGQLDPRLRLAPCQHVEPYLPDGMRPWGKSRVGLRCTAGSVKWNVYLPITVRVFGTALVATNGAAAGAVLTSADVSLAEVDLAEDASPAITNPDLAVGHALARALKPGQSLRLSALKARQWFSAGETVTVSAQGAGFSVAGEGQALNNGIEGQPVRVRTEGGRVLTGLPVGERRVELNL